MSLALRIILACGGLLLGGCAVYDSARRDVSAAAEWKRPVARMRRTAPNISAHKQPVELAEFTLRALQHNPSVLAALARAQARLERIPQVTSLEDPVMRLVPRPEPIQTAAGDTVFTMAVTQKIPLPAKLDLKGQMAAAELREAIEELNSRRLQVIADVERAYYRVYVADRSIEITDANIALLRELERVVQAQYEVNQAQQQDVLRVQTELSELENARTRYRGQRVSAVAALNQLIDRPTDTPIGTLRPVEPAAIHDRVETLIELAAEHNPELASFEYRLERDRKAIALAELAYVPDVTLGFEWNRGVGRTPFVPPVNPQTGRRPRFNDDSAEGDDNWGISVGLNLPIWAQRNEAAKREARLRLTETMREERATENLVAFRIHDAWARATTLQDTIAMLERTIIPQARQTYDVCLPAYQGGTLDFLTVIENWRQLLSFELMLHREVADLQTALAELQREVGVSLILAADAQEVTP